MYPGEMENAVAGGHSIAHLELADVDAHRGRRVRCRAKDTATCDNGHKPLDCSSYPFFPVMPAAANGGAVRLAVKDEVCPLRSDQMRDHQRYVRRAWQEVIAKNPAVTSWLSSIAAEIYDADCEIVELANGLADR
jgi:hypothetical protein